MARSTSKPDTNAIDRTWWLDGPAAVFTKFTWEFGQAYDSHKDLGDLRIAGYYAMNAAITAWSLVDWIAKDLSEHDGWPDAVAALGVGSRTALAEHARADRFVAACEQIAIAAKHRSLNNGYRPGYEVTDRVVTTVYVDDTVATRFMMVRLPNGEFDVRIVLHETMKWWQGTLHKLGYLA